MERYWIIIADGREFEYLEWNEAVEDFKLYAEDINYTTVELYDPAIKAVLVESELNIIEDKLGLLE